MYTLECWHVNYILSFLILLWTCYNFTGKLMVVLNPKSQLISKFYSPSTSHDPSSNSSPKTLGQKRLMAVSSPQTWLATIMEVLNEKRVQKRNWSASGPDSWPKFFIFYFFRTQIHSSYKACNWPFLRSNGCAISYTVLQVKSFTLTCHVARARASFI